MWRGNPDRFDMVKGVKAEKEGQTGLKEINILADGAREFLCQSLVRVPLCADSRSSPNTAPFSGCNNVPPSGRRDEVSQIDQMKKI
jgi:hypothetical protein